ncbi:MAG: histidine phosphatase family protein [Massilia sp.]
MQLYLVRHPPPIVAAGVCYGRSDLAVDPREQARIVAALLPHLPEGAPLYSSPLRRCADLAVALDRGPVILDERLMEIDFGSWELRAWDDIGRAEIDAWAADTCGYRPGGGESVLHMATRIAAFHDALLAAGKTQAVVICHAGAIRLLRERARGLAPPEMARAAAAASHRIAYGELVLLP